MHQYFLQLASHRNTDREAEIDPRFPSADKIYTFNLIFTPPQKIYFYFIILIFN